MRPIVTLPVQTVHGHSYEETQDFIIRSWWLTA